MNPGSNNIPLACFVGGEWRHNFRLREFQNDDGIVCVHSSVIESLELLRQSLRDECGEEVWIIITGGTRTPEDNARLGARLGWTDEGGLVSRDSKHLLKYGGIAVDIVAVLKRHPHNRINQSRLGALASRYFDWVKSDYRDGHVHCDNRIGGGT